MGAIYFSLDTVLESWRISRDQLALQKVISQVMDEVVSGGPASYCIRDSLELISAGINRIEFVPPWIDDSHTVAHKNFIYTLNRKIKPGTALPIGEMRLAESQEYQFIPIRKVELENSSISQVKLGSALPGGSELKFIYHPDVKSNPDVVRILWWDAKNQHIYLEGIDGVKNLSQNSLGVKITAMELRYYDNTNKLITDSAWVDNKNLDVITGVEVYIEAQLEKHTQSLIGFANLRNAPMRSGYLALQPETQLPIPDSRNIHTLLLTNISGVSNGDKLQLEAVPEKGKIWRVTITFGKAGGSNPKIESYTLEYPPGRIIYTEYPRMSIDVGLNLLALDANGRYDYDDDEDKDDLVILEGEVTLKVKKMDIEGVGLFIH